MNKKNIKKALAPLALSALVAGGAFAVLSTSDVDTNTHSITAGSFNVDFVVENGAEDGYGIKLDTAVPMSDAYALENVAPYTFDLQNLGTVDAVLKIGAVNLAASEEKVMLPDALIRVRIAEGENVVFDGSLETLKAIGGASKTITLAGKSAEDAEDGEVRTFDLIAYIDEDAVNADLYEDEEGNPVSKDINFGLAIYYAQEDGGAFTYENGEVGDGATSWATLFPAS